MTTLTVGTGQEYTTLTAAVAAAHTGDTIDVQAGTYTNDFPGLINGLTIEGVGGIAKFVATAQPGNGKAIFDVAGTTTLANLDISGVTVPDANGAAIRYESGKLTIQNTSIHNNQDGILGASDPNGTITITGSEIYGNGTGTGSTHNIYIGDIATFTLTNSYIHDANTGHEVKSRAENNNIINNLIEDNNGTASYEIDLPNGGNATITGNTIQKSANSGNQVSIAYGEEYVPGSSVPEQKLNAGTSVILSNNVFVSNQSGADVVWDKTNATFTASGNSIYGYSLIDKASNVSSSGFTTLSSRPAISTVSPINPAGGTTASTGTPTPTPTPVADTTPPSFKKITESASGISNHTTNTISGAVTDSGSGVAKVEIYDTTASGTADLGSATLSNGTFTFNASNLANGSHAFDAVAVDKAGNATSHTPAGSALIVDTIAPALSSVTQSVSGTTTQTSNKISGSVSDAGTGVASVEVFVTSGTTTTDLGSATLNGNAWSYTVSNLALGTYTFSASATDKAGNTSARVSTLSSETVVAPTPPPSSSSTTTPTPPASVQPGLQSVSQDRTALVFSGTANAGSYIVINDTINGHALFVGSTITRSDGTWSTTVDGLDTRSVNNVAALVFDGKSLTQAGASMILASPGTETLSGTAGKADLFAFLPSFGNPTINGFETTAAVGSSHDVIDLAGSGFKSFQQLQITDHGSYASIKVDASDSIKLSGVAANSLQASDFRFS